MDCVLQVNILSSAKFSTVIRFVAKASYEVHAAIKKYAFDPLKRFLAGNVKIRNLF